MRTGARRTIRRRRRAAPDTDTEAITSSHHPQHGTVPDRAVVDMLIAERGRFFGFLLNRVGDPDTAEDLLQTATLQAIRRAESLRDDDRVVAWIYRILRNVLADHGRRNAASARAGERASALEDLPEVAPPELEAEICACVGTLLGTLPREQGELLRWVELEDQAPSDVATRLGITPGAARVRLHRARGALRDRVEQLCRTCARHGCLDCTCSGAPA